MAKLGNRQMESVYEVIYRRVPDWIKNELHPRNKRGWLEHGGPLLANDGRDFVQERHEELLDALVYQQVVELEDGKSVINHVFWWFLRFLLTLSRFQRGRRVDTENENA